MSFEEKLTWVNATTTALVALVYAWIGRGDLVGYYVSSALMVGVLGITMLEAAYFWIANGMFAAFMIAGLVSSVVKLVAYRRGF